MFYMKYMINRELLIDLFSDVNFEDKLKIRRIVGAYDNPNCYYDNVYKVVILKIGGKKYTIHRCTYDILKIENIGE